MSILASLGIIGWESIEHVILAACLCKLPVMLIGDHGSNKTEAAEIISKALLGPESTFIKYDTPLLQSDDFMGVYSPKSLMEDQISYLSTPISVWKADACLFDELNRANPFTAAKLMEAIRTKKVMGMDTKLQYVWGACNPPEEYDSIYLDLAGASRWVLVKVPGTKELGIQNLKKIIGLTQSKPQARISSESLKTFSDSIARANAIQFSVETQNKLVELVAKIGMELVKSVKISARSLQSIYKLLLAGTQLEAAKVIPELTIGQRADLILSCVPEVFNITKKKIPLNVISSGLNVLLASFKVGDTLLSCATLEELIHFEGTDILAWSASVRESVLAERDPAVIKLFARHLYKDRFLQGKMDQKHFNSLADVVTTQYLHVVNIHTLPATVYNSYAGYNRFGLKSLIQFIFD